jgi:hypothetical protein
MDVFLNARSKTTGALITPILLLRLHLQLRLDLLLRLYFTCFILVPVAGEMLPVSNLFIGVRRTPYLRENLYVRFGYS